MSVYTLTDNFEWCKRESMFIPDKVRSRSVAFLKDSDEDFNSVWNYDDDVITTPRNPKLILDFSQPCSENEREKCRSFWKMVDLSSDLQPALGIPMFPKPEPLCEPESKPCEEPKVNKYPWITQLIILQKQGIDEVALRNKTASIPPYPNISTLTKIRQSYSPNQQNSCLDELLAEMGDKQEALQMLLKRPSGDPSTPKPSLS